MINDNLEIEYSNLQLEETRNGTCPSCGEKKFYITRKPYGLAYLCFRASCGLKGYTNNPGYVPQPTLPAKPASRKEYTDETCLLDYADLKYFQQRFQINLLRSPKDAARWLKVEKETQRYVLPIWGPDNTHRGVVVRRPTWGGACPRQDVLGSSVPKAKTYATGTPLAWYVAGTGGTVILVEDQISALRLWSMGYTAAALLGTNFQQDFMLDIAKVPGRYVLALDPDAFHKSLDLARKWAPAFQGGLRVAALAADPKDYADSDELRRDLGL